MVTTVILSIQGGLLHSKQSAILLAPDSINLK